MVCAGSGCESAWIAIAALGCLQHLMLYEHRLLFASRWRGTSCPGSLALQRVGHWLWGWEAFLSLCDMCVLQDFVFWLWAQRSGALRSRFQ